MQEHDVVGIGNAIVDIIARCDDAFLTRHGRTKGSMQLVDAATVGKLYEAMGPAVEISGGSVANTMVGVASFGGRAGFIGKTAERSVRPGLRPRHPHRGRDLHDAAGAPGASRPGAASFW